MMSVGHRGIPYSASPDNGPAIQLDQLGLDKTALDLASPPRAYILYILQLSLLIQLNHLTDGSR